MITRQEATDKIQAAKKEKNLTYAQIAQSVGRHPVWVAAALLGQASMSAEETGKAVEALGLGPEVATALEEHGPGRPSHLPAARDYSGVRHGHQRRRARRVRRRHHERHRLRDRRAEAGRPQRRPRGDHLQRQIPPLPQVVMEGGLSAKRMMDYAAEAANPAGPCPSRIRNGASCRADVLASRRGSRLKHSPGPAISAAKDPTRSPKAHYTCIERVSSTH
jgi:hypothetical protein